jgi:hypothetical protein
MLFEGGCLTIRGVDTLNLLSSRLPDGAVTTDAEILRERAIDSWALALLPASAATSFRCRPRWSSRPARKMRPR